MWNSNRFFITKKKIINEINVTPFIDIMLVLLVIFMISAPMMEPGIQVDLPKTVSSPISGDDKTLVITVNKHGNLYLRNQATDITQLNKKIAELSYNDKETRIFIRADKEANYGKIVTVMSIIQAFGFTKIALITSHD